MDNEFTVLHCELFSHTQRTVGVVQSVRTIVPHAEVHYSNRGIVKINQDVQIGPKIKFCLFPLSDRPTKFAATQNILLPHLMKKYFVEVFFFIRIILYLNLVNVSNNAVIKH
jgi:hypothetical protein